MLILPLYPYLQTWTSGHIPVVAQVHPSITSDRHLWSLYKGYLLRSPQHTHQIDLMHGSRFNIKMSSCQYRNSRYENKTVSLLTYLYYGNTHIWKDHIHIETGRRWFPRTLNMMTSSNGNIFRVTGHLCGEFPTQSPVTRSLDVFFDLRLNKQLNKQSWGWWFATLSALIMTSL